MELIIKLSCGYVLGMCGLMLISFISPATDGGLTSNHGFWDLEDHEHPGGKMW